MKNDKPVSETTQGSTYVDRLDLHEGKIDLPSEELDRRFCMMLPDSLHAPWPSGLGNSRAHSLSARRYS
jgi:hypothetical protein